MADQAKQGRSVGATILGGFFGLVGGTGLGIYLQQADVLASNNKLSLLVPFAGLVVGVLAGLKGGRKAKA